MKKQTLLRRVLIAGAVLATLACGRAHAATATVATDVCAADANPCNVTQIYDVTNNAVLDFGVRTLNISGSGQFNFGAGSGKIRSGNFTANTASPAIDANGPGAFIGTDSGSVLIEARRQCTGGNPNVPCIDLADCQLGNCNTRRCTLNTARTCLLDANCQVGPCGTNKRCAGSPTFLRCSTNADCDYGTCPAQLTCENRAENPVSCSINSDCDFGTCTIGSASITMGGSIVGNSDNPASIELRAADSVSISKTINLDSSDIESDGGDLTVEAAAGNVTLTGKISATGGGDSQGGTIDISAGTDVQIVAEIDVDGGDFDGGAVEISADQDVTIERSFSADSTAGAGFGGEILLEAGRDLTIKAPSSLNKTTLSTSGHTDIENFSGDGGTQDIVSGRHTSMLENTRLVGNGSIPDAYGSDMYFDVSGNLVLNGSITAKATGGQGEGGYVEIVADGTSSVGTTGSFDLTGGNSGGGVLQFESNGNTDFAGLADASGSNGGLGGSLVLDIDADTTVSGTLLVNGFNGGDIDVEACRVTLASGGKLDNRVTTGDNRITARESMKLLAGSAMTTGASGDNKLIYRTAAKPPLVQGTVTPAPILQVNASLTGCPVCGNAEIDQTETCDDGNTVNGDGCSSGCQNEKCLTQTDGPFPCTTNADCDAPRTCDALAQKCIPNAICDDSDPCTDDTCNTALADGTCQHAPKVCSDAHACTTDSCNAVSGACEHVASNAACEDGNVCTTNVCSVSTGCSSTNNNNACTDNNNCTENDACIAGACTGTPVQGCAVCGNGSKEGGEACDDGNATFTSGEYCGVDCVLIPCGKPTNSTGILPKSSDAQFTLRAAVGQVTCSKYVCDADGNMNVVTTDALRILRKAVGQVVTLACPPPP